MVEVVLLDLIVAVLLNVVDGEVLPGPVVGVTLPLDIMVEDIVVSRLVLLVTAVEVVQVLVEPVPDTVKEEPLGTVALEMASDLVEAAVKELATLVLLRPDSEVDA